jgi:hypothetical protein
MKHFSAKQFCFLACLLCWGLTATAQEITPDLAKNKSGVCTHQCCCSGNYTPVGIMTDHLHPKGEWALSYSFMQMNMQGNQSGTKTLSSDAVLTDYAMAPTRMTMQMHMLMGMYGLSNRLTLMAMLNYNRNNMSMDMAPMDHMMHMPGMDMGMMNMPSTCQSAGLGDTKLWALYRLLNAGTKRVTVAAGLNVPTGSTAVNGATMLGENTRLPYMMQLGSGTWDLLPAITYTDRYGNFFWGANVEGSIPLGTNTRGYAWGAQVKTSAWLSYKCLPWAAASLRLEGSHAGQISGYDAQIAPLMLNDPCADAAHTGGQRVQTYLGLNFSQLGNWLPGATLQFEYGLPVYQNLNGPQMRLQSTLQASCMYAF